MRKREEKCWGSQDVGRNDGHSGEVFSLFSLKLVYLLTLDPWLLTIKELNLTIIISLLEIFHHEDACHCIFGLTFKCGPACIFKFISQHSLSHLNTCNSPCALSFRCLCSCWTLLGCLFSPSSPSIFYLFFKTTQVPRPWYPLELGLPLLLSLSTQADFTCSLYYRTL